MSDQPISFATLRQTKQSKWRPNAQKVAGCEVTFHSHMSMFANNALLGVVVKVRVWIRGQRKIKRSTTKPLMANLDVTPSTTGLMQPV